MTFDHEYAFGNPFCSFRPVEELVIRPPEGQIGPIEFQDHRQCTGDCQEIALQFELWLTGEAFPDLEPERRQWIWEHLAELQGECLGRGWCVYHAETLKRLAAMMRQYQ